MAGKGPDFWAFSVVRGGKANGRLTAWVDGHEGVLVQLEMVASQLSGSQPALPNFTNPPLNEVAFSVAFDALPGYTSAHAGLFWTEVLDRFTHAQEQPPLVIQAVSEAPFGDLREQLSSQFLSRLPLPRLWLLNGDESELVQLQQDSFSRNWRQTKGQQYPRYERLRTEFEGDFTRFIAFAERKGLGTPAPDRCEVTYVNHIPPGDVWKDFSEIHKVVRSCAQVDSRAFLPTPEDSRYATNYAVRDSSGQFLGRLTIAAEPGLRREDMRPLLVLTLTVRGRPLGTGVRGALAFFDVAREWIVRGFADVTTSDMHARWGRIT